MRTQGRKPAAAIRSLRSAATVAAATPDYVRHAFEVPNDPYFETAEGYLTTVRMPQAWDVSHGSTGTIIAIVDTGVTSVRDLATQVLPGRNFVAGNADAHDDTSIGHGTLVAGVAAATTNNGIGIAGAAWDTSVLPVKVLNAGGVGTDSQVVAGIVWAADHGARVINLSLGGTSPGETLCEAVSYAESEGALSSRRPATEATRAPCIRLRARAPSPSPQRTRTATSRTSRASAPGWASRRPGVGILSTRGDNSYGSVSGTSFSAPLVSAVAALVLGQHPDWSPSQIATQLEDTAQDRGVSGRRSVLRTRSPRCLRGARRAGAGRGAPTDVATRWSRTTRRRQASTLFGPVTATISPEADVDWYLAKTRWPCLSHAGSPGPARRPEPRPELPSAPRALRRGPEPDRGA